MSAPDHDAELRRAFAELRKKDRQSSPAFDRYKLASVGFASDGYHIDFVSKR